MAKRGRLTKPSARNLGSAMCVAEILVVSRHDDTILGRVGDQIIAPIYWDYVNLWDSCNRLVEFNETPDWVKDYLREAVTWHGISLKKG